MLREVEIENGATLEDYASIANLSHHVTELRNEATTLVPRLRGRTVWMVNSTAAGGGVAEMLPRLISLLNELGVRTRWLTISTDRPHFFDVTKRLHNLIHGVGDPTVTAEDRAVYEAVSAENGTEFASRLADRDIIACHDPQPLGACVTAKRQRGVALLWRVHIGLDERTDQTRSAWRFLRPWAAECDRALFSAPEYIPDFLADRSQVLHPAIDPLGHKNRHLHPHKLVGILCNAGLAREHEPIVAPSFSEQAIRFGADGRWHSVVDDGDIGLLYRPTILQVSRWDRLKGFTPLLEAFVELKKKAATAVDPLHRRRLEIVRLVLAGPDPAGLADDPEGQEVLDELCATFRELPDSIQQDVALICLPMASTKENALMVNALQRCASVVVQNSLREGFGLTATEAMWKRVAVLTSRACGLRQQVRPGIDAEQIDDPEDVGAIADALDQLLADPDQRAWLARNAERRVHENFLVFSQVRGWLEALSEL